MARTDVRKQEFIAAVATVAAFLAERFYDGGGIAPTVLLPQSPADDNEKLLSRQGAADMLDVSLSTIDRFVREGELSPVKIAGRHPKFKPTDLARLIRRKQ
jgi:excisionase family DNA binding protein